MAAVTASCKQGPRAAHDSGPRKASAIKWAVIHSAEVSDDAGEDTTAEAVANYFARSTSTASTQLAVDRDSCVRMLPDLVINPAKAAVAELVSDFENAVARSMHRTGG